MDTTRPNGSATTSTTTKAGRAPSGQFTERPSGPRRKPRKPGKLVLKTLSQLDLRTGAAKRVIQLVRTWEAEIGGPEVLTESLRQLIQRAALLSVLIEASEAEWLSGGALAESVYFAAVNSLRRILATIGVDRRGLKDITPPTLADIAAEIAAEKETEVTE
jgi:hypothetical protein